MKRGEPSQLSQGFSEVNQLNTMSLVSSLMTEPPLTTPTYSTPPMYSHFPSTSLPATYYMSLPNPTLKFPPNINTHTTLPHHTLLYSTHSSVPPSIPTPTFQHQSPHTSYPYQNPIHPPYSPYQHHIPKNTPQPPQYTIPNPVTHVQPPMANPKVHLQQLTNPKC